MSREVREALEAAKAKRPAGNSARPDRAAALAAFDERGIGVAARFVAIAPGTFIMGDAAGRGDETLHQVTLTKGFELQATEVTQLQYVLVTGANPSHFSKKGDCADEGHKTVAGVEVCVNNPVEIVSWMEAQQFIARLNQVQDAYTYRLPTEAEWEYAAKAGGFASNAGDLDSAAWYSENSGRQTHATASKTANPLGLYDMLGNVWEWTQDWHGDYPKTAVTDPTGPATGSFRVIRGGSWGSFAGSLRSAHRFSVDPGIRDSGLGFRLVRSSR